MIILIGSVGFYLIIDFSTCQTVKYTILQNQ